MTSMPRRTFLAGIPAGLFATGALMGASGHDEADAAGTAPNVPEAFPAQYPEFVRQVVGASHFDIDTVKELVTARPALAKASWDWGFGDWESALGAASHVGRHDIAELLIAHGARPNLFTFAMLDQVDAVRAIVEANPGVQRTHGPHGITLLAHARFGKAERVVAYLETVGDADVPQPRREISDNERQVYLGDYEFGGGPTDTLRVVEMRNGGFGLQRGEEFPRQLLYQGDHTFSVPGVPSVRIHFRMSKAGDIEALTIHDADLVVTAARMN